MLCRESEKLTDDIFQLLFAFVPPSELAGGWPCFAVSIIMIGLLTAVIGDVASQFGCIVDLNDAVTAITLVAMGTSVPGKYGLVWIGNLHSFPVSNCFLTFLLHHVNQNLNFRLKANLLVGPLLVNYNSLWCTSL